VRPESPLRRPGGEGLACVVGIVCAVVAAIAPFAPAAAADAPYPHKPVRIVVGYPAGSAMDILSRLLATRLGEALGQPVLTENRPGASGTIAHDYVARAAPDGYTLLMGSSSMTMLPATFGERAADPVHAFAPIAMLVAQPLLLATHPAYPATTFPELLALARRAPGTVPYAAGLGTPAHLAAELLMDRAGIRLLHVPYSGSGLVYRDVLSGEIPVTITYPGAVLSLVKGGKLRALAVTSDHRLAALPEVPTIAEAGLRGFEVTSWYCLLAPAGTPAPVVARLNREVVRAMALPEMREQLAELGLEPAAGSAEQLAAAIRTGLERWGPIVKRLGVKVQ
jgi:tripartite-type tricarboxylate transporter receptor subunit TctC